MKPNTEGSESSHIPAIPIGLTLRRNVQGSLYHCAYILNDMKRDETLFDSTPEERKRYEADLKLVDQIHGLCDESDINADTKLEIILDMIIESNEE